jgi:inner membrane protein
MDTLTHVAIGFGLAGLSYIDPTVAHHPEVARAVMLCTVIGQQAPDSDIILRLGGKALYQKEHRGISHAIPAIPIWAFLSSFLVHQLFNGVPFLTLFSWSLIAVIVHIATDVFNSYGTKALWPFSKKWIHLHVIPIFDPFLFGMHALSILLWKGGNFPPAPIFVGLYLILTGYYAWRYLERAELSKQFKPEDTLIPTFSWTIWHVMRKRSDGSYLLGEWKHNKLKWQMEIENHHHHAIEASKSTPEVQALLLFSQYLCATITESENDYIVKWTDVRFRIKRKFPFTVIVYVDKKNNVTYTSVE